MRRLKLRVVTQLQGHTTGSGRTTQNYTQMSLTLSSSLSTSPPGALNRCFIHLNRCVVWDFTYNLILVIGLKLVEISFLLCLKWITNKHLLYSTWNSAQCYVPDWIWGVPGENGYIDTYDWVPSLSTWNYHNIVNQLYPSIKQKVWSLKKNTF